VSAIADEFAQSRFFFFPFFHPGRVLYVKMMEVTPVVAPFMCLLVGSTVAVSPFPTVLSLFRVFTCLCSFFFCFSSLWPLRGIRLFFSGSLSGPVVFISLLFKTLLRRPPRFFLFSVQSISVFLFSLRARFGLVFFFLVLRYHTSLTGSARRFFLQNFKPSLG